MRASKVKTDEWAIIQVLRVNGILVTLSHIHIITFHNKPVYEYKITSCINTSTDPIYQRNKQKQ